jgi:hypothetical protein
MKNFLVASMILAALNVALANHQASEQTQDPQEFIQLFDKTIAKGMLLMNCDGSGGSKIEMYMVKSGHVGGMSLLLKKDGDTTGRFELTGGTGTQGIYTGVLKDATKLSKIESNTLGQQGSEVKMDFTIEGKTEKFNCKITIPMGM